MVKKRTILIAMAVLAIIGLSGSSTIVDRAIAFIIKEEGFESAPYWDNSQWSIGYGTAIGYDRGNKPNVIVSKDQALELLRDWVVGDLTYLKSRILVSVPESLLIALLDFMYNLGRGNVNKIVDRVNNGLSLSEIAAAMQLYHYSNVVPLEALGARRNRETELFV